MRRGGTSASAPNSLMVRECDEGPSCLIVATWQVEEAQVADIQR